MRSHASLARRHARAGERLPDTRVRRGRARRDSARLRLRRRDTARRRSDKRRGRSQRLRRRAGHRHDDPRRAHNRPRKRRDARLGQRVERSGALRRGRDKPHKVRLQGRRAGQAHRAGAHPGSRAHRYRLRRRQRCSRGDSRDPLRGQHHDGAHLRRRLAREHRPRALRPRRVLHRRRSACRRGLPQRENTPCPLRLRLHRRRHRGRRARHGHGRKGRRAPADGHRHQRRAGARRQGRASELLRGLRSGLRGRGDKLRYARCPAR